jgi:hypothetical protein
MAADASSNPETRPSGAGQGGCLVLAVCLVAFGSWLLWRNIAPAPDLADRHAVVTATISSVREERTQDTVAQEPTENLLVVARVRYPWQGQLLEAEVAGWRQRTAAGRGAASAALRVPRVDEEVDLVVDRQQPERCWLPAIGDHPPALRPARGSFLLGLLGGVLLLAGGLGLAGALLPAKPSGEARSA